jgi:Protein of unknown function (DUF2799)
MRWLPLTMLLCALAGCAGMDAEECASADWRAIGYEDGIQGRSAAAFGTHRKACAGHSVRADFDAYLAGRAEGVAQFCRPQNGYQRGLQGEAYAGICPLELEGPFLAAHAEGYGLYERGAVLDQLRKRIRYSQERARSIEYRLAEGTALLIAPGLLPTERATPVIELKQLTEEKIDLARSIEQLEHDYAAAELEYEGYRRYIASQNRG